MKIIFFFLQVHCFPFPFTPHLLVFSKKLPVSASIFDSFQKISWPENILLFEHIYKKERTEPVL